MSTVFWAPVYVTSTVPPIVPNVVLGASARTAPAGGTTAHGLPATTLACAATIGATTTSDGAGTDRAAPSGPRRAHANTTAVAPVGAVYANERTRPVLVTAPTTSAPFAETPTSVDTSASSVAVTLYACAVTSLPTAPSSVARSASCAS
jgi:hypothetical protein